jgi:hypothetical protein
MHKTEQLSPFPSIFNLANEILFERGIKLEQPTVVLQEFPLLEKNGVTSRDFNTPYINNEDQIGGNLYSWIHQSYSVLWETDADKNEITLYTKTNEKLGLRYATLLKMDKSAAITSVSNLSIAYALGELCWKKHFEDKCEVDTSIDDNNKKLKKEFVFGLAKLTLANDENATKVLYRFLKMFDKDVDVSECRRKNEGKSFTIND